GGMPRPYFYGNGPSGQGFEHILIGFVISNRHNKVVVFAVKKLFCHRPLVYTRDPHFNHLIAVDDLQRCIAYEMMKVVEQFARANESQFRMYVAVMPCNGVCFLFNE